MKQKFLAILLALALIMSLLPLTALAAETPLAIPDPVFRANLLSVLSKAAGDPIYPSDMAGLSSLDLDNKGIADLTGIEYAVNLGTLRCQDNQITSLNLSGLSKLRSLHCNNNLLTSLNLEGCTSLFQVYCEYNRLTSLDLSDAADLDFLGCNNNQLTSLTLKSAPRTGKLRYIECYENQLASLDVSVQPLLKNVYAWENKLQTLNIFDTPTLEEVQVYENELTRLDVNGRSNLTLLKCQENKLQTLNVNNCPALKRLDCSQNALTYISVSGNSLEYLFCGYNYLTSLSLVACPNLLYLSCRDNVITNLVVLSPRLETLDCTNNRLTTLDTFYQPELKELFCPVNRLERLSVTGNPLLETLYCYENRLRTLDLRNNAALTILDCAANYFPDESAIQGLDLLNLTEYLFDPQSDPLPEDETITFADPALKSAILAKLRKGQNEDVYRRDTEDIVTLDIKGLGITDLSGIENFRNLRTLDCSNNELTDISPLDNLPSLEMLNCSNNRLTTLSLPNANALKALTCADNEIDLLWLDGCQELFFLDCRNNELTDLDLRENHKLKTLICSGNNIQTLQLSRGVEVVGFARAAAQTERNLLEELDCSNNQLAALDLSACANLLSLNCSGNLLTELDLSNNPSLKTLLCGNNRFPSPAAIRGIDIGMLETFEYGEQNVPGLLGLIILEPPVKTAYTEGEALDLTGLVVGAEYASGAKTVSDYTVNPAHGTVLGMEDDTVTVRYAENGIIMTASFAITVTDAVREPVLAGIEATSLPVKTAYFTGEALDLAGLVVMAKYDIAPDKQVAQYGTTPADGAILSVGDNAVVISYTENGVTQAASFDIMVSHRPIRSNEVDVCGVTLGFTVTNGIAEFRPTEEQIASISGSVGSIVSFDLSAFEDIKGVDFYLGSRWLKGVDKAFRFDLSTGSYSVKTKSIWNNSGKTRLIMVRDGIALTNVG